MFLPPCHQKRALEKAGRVAEHVCAEVPHRQFVFTVPKRLRIYFRFDRRLLGDLCRAAARTVITVYRAGSGRPDAVPGMVGAIQTFGQLIHWHPHIHALVTEGVFLPQGTFLPLPKLATEPFLKLWEQEVFALLLAEGKITEEVVANMRSWKHSGFSVDQSVRLEAGDQEGVQRLIQYFPCKQVCAADPNCCPQCGSATKIISFIERHQTDVIEKILRHCGLWEEIPAGAPPPAKMSVTG